MNTLILINQAPNYCYTYKRIGDTLKIKGHSVLYAIDNRYTTHVYNDCFENDDQLIFFSDFFKENENKEIKNKEFFKYNLYQSFFSDFERASIYKLHKKKKRTYYKNIINNLFNFFEEVLISNKIDLVIYENVSNAFAYSAYLVSEHNSINYCGITSTVLPNRFSIQEKPIYDSESIINNYDELKESKKEIPDEDKKWIEEYYQKFFETEPDYMKKNRVALKENIFDKYFKWKKVNQTIEIFKFLIKDKEKQNFYNFQSPVPSITKAYFKRNTNRKFRLKKINRLYDINDLHDIKEDDFFVYPIHFHPESSTSVLASSYVNEYHNILNIAMNLPFEYTLYVKEHPSAVGFNTVGFYKKIQEIPNVKLVNHAINARSLVKKSKGVITITSTMGFEALVMEKKVFLFGRVFYENHPNCIRVINFNELFDSIKNNLNKDSNEDALKFIYAYYLETFSGKVSYEKNVDTEFVKSVCNQILDRF